MHVIVVIGRLEMSDKRKGLAAKIHGAAESASYNMV
jgi:hypothetical protein